MIVKAGEFFPFDVLHMVDQSGNEYPVSASVDVRARIEENEGVLCLTGSPERDGHLIKCDMGGEKDLILRPAPLRELRLRNASMEKENG